MDLFSKSDPFCVTFIRPFGSDKWHELHRTEIVMNNLHPEWTAKARVMDCKTAQACTSRTR